MIVSDLRGFEGRFNVLLERKKKLKKIGFAIGFFCIWQLSLLTLAMVPLIVVVGDVRNMSRGNG